MKSIFILTIVLLISGCATTMRYTASGAKPACKQPPYVYGGTYIDWYMITRGVDDSGPDDTLVTEKIIGVVDLPLSVIADSVLLPVSIPMEMNRKNKCEHCEDLNITGQKPNNKGIE
jgi:uncharacterized protein YceK